MVSEYTLARILKYCLQKAGRYRDDMIACFDSPESFLEEAEFTHVAQDENRNLVEQAWNCCSKIDPGTRTSISGFGAISNYSTT